MKTKIVSCHTVDSKPVKQEVSGTVMLPPLVFPVESVDSAETNVRKPFCKIFNSSFYVPRQSA